MSDDRWHRRVHPHFLKEREDTNRQWLLSWGAFSSVRSFWAAILSSMLRVIIYPVPFLNRLAKAICKFDWNPTRTRAFFTGTILFVGEPALLGDLVHHGPIVAMSFLAIFKWDLSDKYHRRLDKKRSWDVVRCSFSLQCCVRPPVQIATNILLWLFTT